MNYKRALLVPKADELVSVVVPAFNAESYIKDTIQSVLSQTYESFELLVVDDCSSDKTPHIIEQFIKNDPRVHFLRTSVNLSGPAGPRNLGVKMSRGKWIAFCDADDLWHPKKLEFQLEVAASYKAKFVCSEILDFLDGAYPKCDESFQYLVKDRVKNLNYFQMLQKNRVPTSSVICQRKILINLPYIFNTEKDLAAVEDYDLWLRLLEESCTFIKISAPLVYYRKSNISISKNKLRMVVKAMRVVYRALCRSGWKLWSPLLIPLLFITNAILSIYWRVLRGRL